MSPQTGARAQPRDEDLAAIADEFETREFNSGEIAAIRRTRRRSPRLGEAKAEVRTFRAPPSLMDRIRHRAASDRTTESQVIRDALDAYLSWACNGKVTSDGFSREWSEQLDLFDIDDVQGALKKLNRLGLLSDEFKARQQRYIDGIAPGSRFV